MSSTLNRPTHRRPAAGVTDPVGVTDSKSSLFVARSASKTAMLDPIHLWHGLGSLGD